MAFMVNTDGTILAETAADAVALSELLRGRTAPPVAPTVPYVRVGVATSSTRR